MHYQKPDTHDHWMLAEIFEQPQSLRDTLAFYVEDAAFKEEATISARRWFRGSGKHVAFVASGSSRHAAMVAQSRFTALAHLTGFVDFASEYAFRADAEIEKEPVIVISQSGETGDTLLAMRRAARLQLPTFAVTNVAASSMAREATVSLPTHAGVERAIPATKSFTAQLMALEIAALLAAAEHRTLSQQQVRESLIDLGSLPRMLTEHSAAWLVGARRVADIFSATRSFLFLGRGIHYPIALEGALKMKESAYLPSEGYPSGELRHGPNALIGEGVAVIALVTVDRADAASVLRYDRNVALLKDLRAQDATLICIANRDDHAVAALADECISVPALPEKLAIFAETVCLQLLSYCFATRTGIDVDRPRNLVKSVSVV